MSLNYDGWQKEMIDNIERLDTFITGFEPVIAKDEDGGVHYYDAVRVFKYFKGNKEVSTEYIAWHDGQEVFINLPEEFIEEIKRFLSAETRCMKCGWEGLEKELPYDIENECNVCPNCLTDEYLIDILDQYTCPHTHIASSVGYGFKGGS